MADVLSQAEVDALLSAVDGGEIEAVPSEEISSASGEVAIYDFKRPDRVSKDQMAALENLHENFARSFGATLSGYLRTIVDVKLASVESLTYSEFIMSLPNPTCFNLMTADPLKGKMVLELNTSIVFPLIDKVLGGGMVESSHPDRELTDIELRLIGRITDMAVAHLKDTWGHRRRVIDFKITETEFNPQIVQIVAPNEVVVLVCFEIRIGEASGMMNLCIPYTVIEPIIDEFSSQNWFAYDRQEVTDAQKQNIIKGIKICPMPLRVFVAETEITIADMVRLKVGDIIKTDKKANEPMVLTVGDKPKFRVRPGVLNYKKAFQIESRAAEEEYL